MTEKRTQVLKIRLLENEQQKLLSLAKASNQPLAVWARQFLLTGEQPKAVRADKVAKADPDLIYQLAKIGANINQIARQLNTVDDVQLRIAALAELASIRSQLDKLAIYR